MKRNSYAMALLVGSLLLISASQSWAIGTEADQTISNQASVQFTINGTTTTKDSNLEDFKVDRKIRMVVTSQGDTGVLEGLNNFVLPFRVDNESNTATGTDDYFRLTISGGTDDFDMNNVRLYRDVNGDGLLDGGDTLLFTGAGGAAYVTIGNGTGTNTARYLIVADCPAAGGTPDTALPDLDSIYNLVATAWNGAAAGDGIMVQDTDGNDKTLSEIVFADPAGTASGDAVNGGFHSDAGTYTTNATLGVAKLASGSTSGYNIPGDIVTYDITVSNGDTTYAATNVIVTDAVPGNTTYDSFAAAGCSGTRQWSIDSQANWVNIEPADKTTITDIRCTIASIAVGESSTVSFKVAID
jgi:uncharacterized repeat protein (TIGR01451 family)